MAWWRTEPLGGILAPVSRAERVEPSRTYRILGAHWYAGGLYIKDVKSGREIQADSLYEVREGDFVYNRLFAWKGSFAVATARNDGCYVSSEFPCFLVDRSRVLGKYLLYYFSRPAAWAEALGLSTGGTPTSRNRLKEEKFLAMRVPLPPLDEQRRIVARIEELAAKVEEVRGLRHLVLAGLRKMLEAQYVKITRGVPRLPFGDVAPLVRRPVVVETSGVYPELGIRSFGKGPFHKPALTGAEVGSKKLFRIESGDLLFNIVFAWEGAVAVARSVDHGRVGSHRFLTCVPKTGVATARFLRFHFLTEDGLRSLGEASPGGAGRNRTLGVQALNRIQVPVPPLDTQLWFDQLQDRVELVTGLYSQSDIELDALLPAILERAFRGEL